MLRVLHLEDQADDAFFIHQALVGGGIDARITLAKNRAEFAAALNKGAYDLVLADNGLPAFGSVEALGMAREKCPGIPFICVSGSTSETQVNRCLDAGASLFISKDRPAELVAVVRLEQEKAALVRRNRGMARLVQAVQELSLARDLNGIMAVVRRAARELTGADGATFVLREGEFCHYADEDAIAPLWKGQRFPMKACVSGWAMLHGEPVVIPDIFKDERVPADAYRPTFVKSLAMVPIRADAPIGAVGNYWAEPHSPAREEVELLQALANTTAVAMENVRVYNELEQRVKDRTIELEAANAELALSNQELESFAYAVSHDLGAPLRSIREFTRLALAEAGSTLHPKAREFLGRVEANAGAMRRLVEDLLRLSRIGRTELKRTDVDLTALAGEIVEALAASDPERKVEVEIQPGMQAACDAGLIRIALENLLANAWKYTGKVQHARITFGTLVQPNGEVAFCIRDNGAGFPMEQGHRLFQPFQRLHGQGEFPGSGVGLSTVQRAIHRHGGRVWAEGKENRGAAFYFVLPALEANESGH